MPDKDAATRRHFARRLEQHMVRKGWNQSELAREAARHMPGGKFGRDSVSGYVNQANLPSPLKLNALAKALGVSPQELMPTKDSLFDDDYEKDVELHPVGHDRMRLRINKEVSKRVAFTILGLLAEEEPR